VVNFVTRSGIGLVELREAVNDRLPADVNVLRVEEAAAGFHARHQAIARTYRYQVSLRRDAFRKRYVWWVKSPLDESRLAAEAVALAGFHDFASFTDGGGDDDTTCRVMSAAWSRTGDLALFRIVSDRFLRGMVRRIVGVMVEVGIGRAAPGRIKALLADPSPGAAAAATAPPAGLFLERVDYLAKR
jgi:tRNA pseudouridine38-40 synthase